MARLQCISPIDGKIFAERDTLDLSCAQDVVARVRAAQPAWAARPLQERIDLVLAGIAAVGAMNDVVVPELARMMGRPKRTRRT